MHERKVIAAAVASALAVPMSAEAVEFAVSGHVNRAVIVVDQDDNPKDGDLQHVDANASQSRFRLKGSGELDSGLTAGVNIELGVLSTGSTSGTTTRHAAANLSGDFGTLTPGSYLGGRRRDGPCGGCVQRGILAGRGDELVFLCQLRAGLPEQRRHPHRCPEVRHARPRSGQGLRLDR